MAKLHRAADAENSLGAEPFVSLVIPCRDEKQFIGDCLDSLLANDYPSDRLEILLVDGRSCDGTREIVEKYTKRCRNVRLLDNERGIIPAAMNIGIRAANGKIVMKIDAHCRYAPDHISGCVAALDRYGADNTGGVLVTLPRQDTFVARSIALVLANSFGSGNSYFRIGDVKPRWSDTAAFGCYRREVFEKIGYFDEHLTRSSDMELNVRLRRAGGAILLLPDIKVYYYPGSATLGSFWLRNMVDGFWVFYPLKFRGRSSRLRHGVPGACVLMGAAAFFSGDSLLGAPSPWVILLGLYLAASLAVSARIAWNEGRPALLGVLPPAFAIRHIAYGIGSLAGLAAAVVSSRFWRNLARLDRRTPVGLGSP